MEPGSEEEIVKTLTETFPEEVMEARVLRSKRVIVEVKREALRRVAEFCKEKLGFVYPISAGGVDYPKERVIQLNYYVLSPKRGVVLILRTALPRENPVTETLTTVWEAMNYHERETWEMLGVHFIGHPNLTRLLLPEDWEWGHPLRKDFKLEAWMG